MAMDVESAAAEQLSTLQQSSRRLAVLAAVGLALVFIASVFYNPSPVRPDGQYFTICGFKNFTGLPCPGCGLTHSFCALGKGDLAAAVSYNLLGPPLFAALFLLWVRSLSLLLGWSGVVMALDRLSARTKPVLLFAVAFAVFGAARILYLLIT